MPQNVQNVTSVNTVDHQEFTALIDLDCKLHSFTPTTADELTTLLAKVWGKSCMLDPLPGKLMIDCSDTLLPVIVRTVNLSFEEAVVPAKFKHGVLTPKLKKPSLDNELFPSFRPISNLRFISKATEKVVAARLNSYLDDSSYVLGMDIHLDVIYFMEFHKDLCWDQSYTYYILHPLQMLLKSITCLITFTQTIRKSICPSSLPVTSSLLMRLGQQ